MAVKVRIHRGATEIGGSCVELCAQGQRLLIDVGRPLDLSPGQLAELPATLERTTDLNHLLGVLLSHGHQDHYGLVDKLEPDTPIYIGQAAAAILDAAAFFTPSGVSLQPAGFLEDRRTFSLGPFQITPYLVDHSAFDSYALLIQAQGRRLFYSGDFRAHGRKPGTMRRLLCDPPRDVDVLILEGTHVRASGTDSRGIDESDVELVMAETICSSEGLGLVFSSAQNIDRLVSVYRACKRVGRVLVVDLYTATIATATGRSTIPQPGHPNLRIYVPNRQRILVKESREFERVECIRDQRVFLEEIAENPGRFVMLAQGSTVPELAKHGCLQSARASWSLWPGYLDERSGQRTSSTLRAHGVPLEQIHASGHAAVEDLQALAEALSPARVVPIHTQAPGRYVELFANVHPQADGSWWQV